MAELRYVKIPEDADVTVGEDRWGFTRSLVHVVDAHPGFNQSGVGIRAALRIIALFEGKVPGDVVAMDQADWKLLSAAFESPTVALNAGNAGYIPVLARVVNGEMQKLIVPARAFVAYLDAVSDEATKTKPEQESAAPKSPNGAAAIVEASSPAQAI